jgi:hypothetical protein
MTSGRATLVARAHVVKSSLRRQEWQGGQEPTAQ